MNNYIFGSCSLRGGYRINRKIIKKRTKYVKKEVIVNINTIFSLSKLFNLI